MLYIDLKKTWKWNNSLKFGLQEAAEAALRNYEAEADKIRQKEDRPPPSTQTQQQTRDKVRSSAEHLTSKPYLCHEIEIITHQGLVIRHKR